MTEERWQRLEEALAAALELPEGERAAELGARLGDDAVMLREAEQMLAGEGAAAEYFERGRGGNGVPAAGGRLGPWQLVRELGRGGMGVVWLAERADGEAEMRAAVKFLDVPYAGPEERRRFAAEKHLLARLEHPHIARLLDAGREAAWAPHFVLEYVDGVPLTTYAAGVSERERIGLLIQIASAVQHAHSKLVIHRDLKPANILVTREGAAKLLDFGVGRLAEGASNTNTIFRAMSLDYASPEQIRGEEVSTATDIYSLGLVFFEALTGRRARRWGEKGIGEVVREAERFRLPPEGVLHPDLRAILDQATDAEPGRRYASAAALAADLTRFLEKRPVEARPRTVLYTLQRFVARNSWGVAAGVCLAVLVTGLAAATVAAGWRAEANRQVADRRLAQVEAANLETRAALAKAEEERRRAEARQRDLEEMGFSLVNETYRDLQELPGATGTRARLLQKTLGRLERLRRSVGENRELVLLIADAHGRLGEELGGSNENLGDPKTAHRHYAQRVSTLEEWRRRQPEDTQIWRLWADAKSGLWQFEKKLGRNPNPADMRALAGAWDDLVQREPRDVAVLRAAGTYYFRSAMSVESDPVLRRAAYKKAIALWEREEAVSGGEETVWRNLALGNKYVANVEQKLKNFEAQLAHAEKARSYDQRRLDRSPANSQARMDLTFDLTSIGDYYSIRPGQAGTAVRHYREALRQRQTLVAVEPTNAWYQRSLLYPAQYAAYYSWVAGDWKGLAEDLAVFRRESGRSANATVSAMASFLSGEFAWHEGRRPEACVAWREAERQGYSDARLTEKINGCRETPGAGVIQ